MENIVGKGENAGYQHFLLFPQCFPKPSLESLKVGIACERVKHQSSNPYGTKQKFSVKRQFRFYHLFNDQCFTPYHEIPIFNI